MKNFIIILLIITVSNANSQDLGYTRREITNHLNKQLSDTKCTECGLSYKHEDDKIIALSICNGDTVTYNYYLSASDFEGEFCDSISIDYNFEACYIEKKHDILYFDFKNYIKLNDDTILCVNSNFSTKQRGSPTIFYYQTMTTSRLNYSKQYRITLYYEQLTKKEFKGLMKTVPNED